MEARAVLAVAVTVAAGLGAWVVVKIRKRTPGGEVTIDELGTEAGNALAQLGDALAPIGVRQRNPMHVRATSTAWQGELPGSGGYEWFATAEDGIRAGALLVRNYGRLYGLRTVKGIITRFAPKEDANPTAAYIANVVKWTGFGEDQPLDTNNADVLFRLSKAMIRQEIGTVWAATYSDDAIRRGVTRALQA